MRTLSIYVDIPKKFRTTKLLPKFVADLPKLINDVIPEYAKDEYPIDGGDVWGAFGVQIPFKAFGFTEDDIPYRNSDKYDRIRDAIHKAVDSYGKL